MIHGDLRDLSTSASSHEVGQYDLVTGTPPYIPLGAGGMSVRPQKEACCLETRGGLEEYCKAAAAALAPGGCFVVCAGKSDAQITVCMTPHSSALVLVWQGPVVMSPVCCSYAMSDCLHCGSW